MNTQGSVIQLSSGGGLQRTADQHHMRNPSDFMQSSERRTEPANTPLHIVQGGGGGGKISRKQSDFSFASQSNQKIGAGGGGSATRSPRVMNASGSYANRFQERKQQLS